MTYWRSLKYRTVSLSLRAPQWKKVPKQELSPQEWYDKHQELKNDPSYSLAKTNNGSEWNLKRYMVNEYAKRMQLFVSNGNGELIIYYCRQDMKKDRAAGRDALKKVSEKFEELTGTSFASAFPRLDKDKYHDYIIEFSRCTPMDIQITFPEKTHAYYSYGGQVDGCSQYPSNARGKMPSLNPNDWLEVKGWIDQKDLPEGYDFEFSLVSGHVLERGRFDSHDILKLYPERINDVFRTEATKNTNLQQPYYPKEQERVLLMKSAPYELTKVMEYFYKVKETYDHDSADYVAAKLVLNAFVGMLGPNTNNLYAGCECRHPMRAIVLWRAAFSIMSKAQEIGWSNILDISIDGILYASAKPSKLYGQTVKHIGQYHQEAQNQPLYFRGHNTYCFQNKDGTIGKMKHGAYDAYKGKVWNDKTDKLTSVLDMENFERSKLQDNIKELRAYYEKLNAQRRRRN